jgi:hypothetical protein
LHLLEHVLTREPALPDGSVAPLRPSDPFRRTLDEFVGTWLPTLIDEHEVEARIRITVGEAYSGLNDLEEAESQLRAAIVLLEEHPNSDGHNLARVLGGLGNVLRLRGVTHEAPGAAAHEFVLTLSGSIPPRECTTFTFLGTSPGQTLQYQFLPGDTNLDGVVSTQDLLFLVQRMSNSSANQPDNFARFNINRSQESGGVRVTTQDLLRLVQLLDGVNTTQVFNGAAVAACLRPDSWLRSARGPLRAITV